MKRTYSIYTRYLEIELEFTTKSVETHSVMSDDNELGLELRQILLQGADFIRGLILDFERKHKDELEKIGK